MVQRTGRGEGMCKRRCRESWRGALLYQSGGHSAQSPLVCVGRHRESAHAPSRSAIAYEDMSPKRGASIDDVRDTIRFRDATLADVSSIAALHNSVAGALTARFGEGPWSSLVTERAGASSQRHARVRVGRIGKRLVTVLRLANKKPWAIDVSYFTPVKRPIYLTGMSVAVALQSRGYGRLALEDAVRLAR